MRAKRTSEENRIKSLQKFDITPGEYDRMLKRQGGGCAICSREPSEHRRLAVDHDHKTKEIRGLLCGRCNVALGLLDDSVSRLLEAIYYLKG